MNRRFGDSKTRRYNHFTLSLFHRFAISLNSRRGGFTLLEILVALAILGIAITIVLQLFSSNLKALSASEDYIAAVTKAKAEMREILEDENLSEKSWSETTDDGYRLDVSITEPETFKDKTDYLQVKMVEVALTVHWEKGTKEKSLTLKTMKVLYKKI